MTANVPPNQTVYVNNLPEKLKKDGKLLTLAHTTNKSLFFSFSFYLPPFPPSPLPLFPLPPSPPREVGAFSPLPCKSPPLFSHVIALFFTAWMSTDFSPTQRNTKQRSPRAGQNGRRGHLVTPTFSSSPPPLPPLPDPSAHPRLLSLAHPHPHPDLQIQIYTYTSTPTPTPTPTSTPTSRSYHPFPPLFLPPSLSLFSSSPPLRVEEAALRHLQSVRPRPRHRRPENVPTPWSGVDCLWRRSRRDPRDPLFTGFSLFR